MTTKTQNIKKVLRDAISNEKENLMNVTVHMYPSLRQFLLHSVSPPTTVPKKQPLKSHSGNIMPSVPPPRQQQLSEEFFGPYKVHVQDFFKKIKSHFKTEDPTFKTEGLTDHSEHEIPAFIESFTLSTENNGKKTNYNLILLTSPVIEQAQREMFPFFQKFPKHHFLLAVLLKNEKVVHMDSISLDKKMFTKKHSK
uniref:Uncharacterized protein n=1 Tax=viral metagenome TaxID=1070528 RepID=A0A6C0D0V8_9ZZZZ